MLKPASGWRMGPTYVLVLSSANVDKPNPPDSPNYKNDVINKVNSMAYTYAIDLVAGAGNFIQQYVRAPIGRVSDPSSLTLSNPVSQLMISTFDTQYKNSRFPPPTDLGHVYGDFVFVIDQTQTMGQTDFATIKTFLVNFVTNLTTISSFNSQVGIVSYNSAGVIGTSSFHLTDYLNLPDLVSAIVNLSYANSFDGSADILSTLTYLNNYETTPAQGHRMANPLFVTFIAAAQNITSSYLDQSQIDKLNANANVFGFSYSTYKETYQLMLALTNNRPNQVETISSFDSGSVQYFIQYVQQVWQRWAATNTKK